MLLTELRGPYLLSTLPVVPAVFLTRWDHAEQSATCPRVLPFARLHTIFHAEFFKSDMHPHLRYTAKIFAIQFA